MNQFFSTYIKGDRIIWAVFIILLVVSAVTMYSASSSLAYKAVAKGGSFYTPVWQHIVFLLGGLAVAFMVHRIPFKFIMAAVRPGYFGSLLLLLATPFLGVSVNGATRWISLFGILFQPSELVKVFTVLYLATILSQYQNKKDKTPDDGLLRYLAYLMLPAAIIALENLSTCLLLLMVGFLMLFFARLSWKLLLKMVGCGVLAIGLGIGALLLVPEETAPSVNSTEQVVARKGVFHRALTWKHRILHFFDESRPHDENYQLTDETYQEDRAKIAVANGKWLGLGIGNSIQRDFLPLAFADFIFSLMIEEMGLGALLVVILYLIFMYRVGVLIREYCNSVVQSLIALGLSSMIMIQTYINVFIAVGLFPVSGQPLPLLSRGGTSILITSFYFGVILCISANAMECPQGKNKKEKSSTPVEKEDEKPSKEKDELNVSMA